MSHPLSRSRNGRKGNKLQKCCCTCSLTQREVTSHEFLCQRNKGTRRLNRHGTGADIKQVTVLMSPFVMTSVSLYKHQTSYRAFPIKESSSEFWDDCGCEKGRHIPSLLPQLSRALHDMFQRSAEGVWFVLTLGVDASA